MLHLIPDNDGQAHAPTSECGCDPQLGSYQGRPALFHSSPERVPYLPCGPSCDPLSVWTGGIHARDCPTFAEDMRGATISPARLREVLDRDDAGH